MRRRAAHIGAGVWAALIVGLAGRTAWAAGFDDDLPDPPVSAPPPPSPPPAPASPPPTAAKSPAPAAPVKPTATPPTKSPAPPPAAESPGPVPWPTVGGTPPAPPEVAGPRAAGPPPEAAPERAKPAPVVGAATVTPSPAPVAAAPTMTPPPAPPVRRAETSVGIWGQGTLGVDRERNVALALPWLAAWFEHRPASWVRFYAAAELEELDHFGIEQAFIELAPHPAFGVHAGLLLLPLGIINQWHIPTTFLTVERPLTDRLIIPTTWREVGAGLFGALGAYARYDLDIVAGLDAAGFSAAAPLWGGRGNGGVLAAHDAAFVGRLEIGGRGAGPALGGGGYWGRASGGRTELAGVDVGVVEVDARYRGGGFDLRAEAAELFIVDSYKVNDYLGLLGQDQIPARGRGFYAQAGFDVLSLGAAPSGQELLFFAGYENVNPRSRMSPYNYNPPTITGPGEVPPDAPSSAKSFVRGGVDYRPAAWLAIKADVRVALSGEELVPAAPVTVAGAPGTPKPLPSWVAESARGKTLVGFAAALSF